MKTIFVCIFSLLLATYGCHKQKEEFSADQYPQVLNSLPELKVLTLTNLSQYRLRIDTLNRDSVAYYHVSGKLFYQGTLIWQADSTFAINVIGNDSLVFLQNTIAPIGDFSSLLFYEGKDITAKARPSSFPLISDIRLAGSLVYLLYSDYGSFRSHTANSYGVYNLDTGVLKTN